MPVPANIRATPIPAVAVPVVLLGTFGVLALFGYSINTPDPVCDGYWPSACWWMMPSWWWKTSSVLCATRACLPAKPPKKSMGEISGALIAIALVLSAVFLPMAFFGGSTGVIYRQFSVTIISAMMLSVVVALTLTPALCARCSPTLNRIPQDSSKRLTVCGAAPNRATSIACSAGYASSRHDDGRLCADFRRHGVGDVEAAGELPSAGRGSGAKSWSSTISPWAPPPCVPPKYVAVTDWFSKEKANTNVIFTVDGFNLQRQRTKRRDGLRVSAENRSERKGAENTACAIAPARHPDLEQHSRDASLFA